MNWCLVGLSADENPIESEPCGFRGLLPLIAHQVAFGRGLYCSLLSGLQLCPSPVLQLWKVWKLLPWGIVCVFLGQGLPLRWEPCFCVNMIMILQQTEFFLLFCCDVLASKCPQLLLRCLPLTVIGLLNLDPSGLDNRCVLRSLGCSRVFKEVRRL